MEQNQNSKQDDYERKFIVIPFAVMADKRLTLADKIIYGRAYFFDEFFESPAKTAEVVGCSENQVKISKRKLEKLGLLRCTSDGGRGKRFVAVLPSRSAGYQNLTPRVSKSDTQSIKKCHSEYQNLTPENKEENKAENKEKDVDESTGATAPEGSSNKDEAEYIPELDGNIHTLMIHHPGSVETVKVFGNAHVNELMEAWKDATGFDHSRIKSERYAMASLIKQYGYEATKALVTRVKRATQSNDRYAPQIARASQLRGKYSKLEALIQWERRTKAIQAEEEAKKPKEPNFAALYPTFSRANEPDDTPDTPEQQAERHRVTQELRKKYGFRKLEGSK